jgi:NADH-quinone oxidoreductase subunit N
VAAAFSLFLLAFAGIPFTSGFISKFTAFGAAVAHGAVLLAVVGVLASAVAFGFYTRVIVLMYFASPATSPLPDGSPSTAPAAESGAGAATAASLTAGAAATASAATTTAEPAPAAPAASFGLTRVATPSVLTAVTVGVAAAATLAIGVFPSPLLDVADRAALFVR